MTVEFELNGQLSSALNGGADFTFSEAISFQVNCKDQDEVDYYWNALSEGGEEGPCGWLKDRFGLSWQIVPTRLTELVDRSGPGAGAACDGGDARDEEARHRRARAGRRRGVSSRRVGRGGDWTKTLSGPIVEPWSCWSVRRHWRR